MLWKKYRDLKPIHFELLDGKVKIKECFGDYWCRKNDCRTNVQFRFKLSVTL
jgi:hypothetical protein